MNGAPWGGSEELWFSTALRLAQSGHKVECAVYHWPKKEERCRQLERAGCRVYRLPNKRLSKGIFFQKFLRYQTAKIALRRTVATLPVREFDVVVVNQGGLEVCTTPWKHFYNGLRKYALVFHNYNAAEKFSEAKKRALRNWTTQAAVNFFAAQKAKDVLQTQLGSVINPSEVIVNPLTFLPPSSAPLYPPAVNDTVIFAVFAALDVRRKSQDKLIRVLSSPKWKKRNWQLHLYGDGPDRALLQQLIRSLELTGRVLVKGHVTNVAEALRASHLVLQITAVDAMPLSVMEALATGRPLVVSSVGDMPLWVQDGHNGWVCLSEETSMDDCLEKAWEQKEQWQAMGQASFRLFQKKFPVDAVATFITQLNKLL